MVKSVRGSNVIDPPKSLGNWTLFVFLQIYIHTTTSKAADEREAFEYICNFFRRHGHQKNNTVLLLQKLRSKGVYFSLAKTNVSDYIHSFYETHNSHIGVHLTFRYIVNSILYSRRSPTLFQYRFCIGFLPSW